MSPYREMQIVVHRRYDLGLLSASLCTVGLLAMIVALIAYSEANRTPAHATLAAKSLRIPQHVADEVVP